MLTTGGMNIFYPLENLSLNLLMIMVSRTQIVFIFLITQKKPKFFQRVNFPQGLLQIIY